MKRIRAVIVILGSTFVVFLIVNFWADRLYKKEFTKFNSSTINARLSILAVDKGYADIVVANQTYVFAPLSVNNNEPDFLFFAAKGDSIFKPAKADTLRLVHHGKTYLYTFEKF